MFRQPGVDGSRDQDQPHRSSATDHLHLLLGQVLPNGVDSIRLADRQALYLVATSPNRADGSGGDATPL